MGHRQLDFRAVEHGGTVNEKLFRLTIIALHTTPIEQVRHNFGNSLNDELIKTLQLDKQALNQPIDKLLMRQAASKLELWVSDQD